MFFEIFAMQKSISSQKQKSKTFRRTSEKMLAEGNPYKIQNAPSVESEGNEKDKTDRNLRKH